jgi:hypothetical protein
MMTEDFSAVEQLSGYLYQVRYALLLLLQENERSLVIENLDDVEFLNQGTVQELLQFKHHVKRKGGLSDRSTDLWKTIRIWANRILHNQVDAQNIRLTLITTSVSNERSIASYVKNQSKSVDEITSLLIDIAEQGGNDTNKEAYEAFLKLNKHQRRDLVKCIRIVDGAPLNIELSTMIEKELRNAALPQHRVKFREQLEGWWLDRVVRSFAEDALKTISRNELDIVQQEIREGFKRDSLPYYYDINEQLPEEKITKFRTRNYIKQLELIQVSEDSKLTAMKDYYRAYEHRSRWLREDLLSISELPLFDKELCDEWKRKWNFMLEDLQVGATDDVKVKEGKALYRWAANSAQVTMPTRPHWNHVFLTRGSYQMLADELKIGWHPDYPSYFREPVVVAGGKDHD